MTTDQKSGFYYIKLDDSTDNDLKDLSIRNGLSIEELLEAAAKRYGEVELSNINRKENEKKRRQMKKHEKTIENIRMKIIIRDYMTNIKPMLENEAKKKDNDGNK